MLKINSSNIGQIKINGFNIKLAKINNQVVFGDAKYILTYSSYTYKFSGIDSGNYSIKYANGNTILEDYDSIAEITGSSGTYNSLINLNIAPKDATKVVLVKDNEIKAEYIIPSNKLNTDTKLYTIVLLSDIHNAVIVVPEMKPENFNDFLEKRRSFMFAKIKILLQKIIKL